jgi:hypothetical protein
MFEFYEILSTIVKYKTQDPMLWETRCSAQVQLIESFLKYVTTCGVELPPQQEEEICRRFVDIFYFFEKLLEEAKNTEK